MLIDFGTAREYKEEHVEDTICLGTVGYAAPEQLGEWADRCKNRHFLSGKDLVSSFNWS